MPDYSHDSELSKWWGRTEGGEDKQTGKYFYVNM